MPAGCAPASPAALHPAPLAAQWALHPSPTLSCRTPSGSASTPPHCALCLPLAPSARSLRIARARNVPRLRPWRGPPRFCVGCRHAGGSRGAASQCRFVRRPGPEQADRMFLESQVMMRGGAGQVVPRWGRSADLPARAGGGRTTGSFWASSVLLRTSTGTCWPGGEVPQGSAKEARLFLPGGWWRPSHQGLGSGRNIGKLLGILHLFKDLHWHLLARWEVSHKTQGCFFTGGWWRPSHQDLRGVTGSSWASPILLRLPLTPTARWADTPRAQYKS